MPSDCVQEVKDTFMECAESESLELNEIPKHSDIRQVRHKGPFRSFELKPMMIKNFTVQSLYNMPRYGFGYNKVMWLPVFLPWNFTKKL